MSKVFSLNQQLDDFWIFPKLTKEFDLRGNENDFFDFLEEQNENKDKKISLYVHIPFCESDCMFCPYFKVPRIQNKKEVIDEYLLAIQSEMERYAKTFYFGTSNISAVHLGGGNPLFIGVKNIKKIVEMIGNLFQLENISWSLEGSLCCVTDYRDMRELKSMGFERMSFGIQTFQEHIRKNMHIRTTIDEINKGTAILQEAGIQYCYDMMYNLPDQSLDMLVDDLEKVNLLDPYHVDVYNMALFPNTYIEKYIKSDQVLIKPSNENSRLCFRTAHEWLIENGYYNIISHTYSKKQKKVHLGDELYLMSGNVLGIGVSARSYIDGNVFKNVCDYSSYIKTVNHDYPSDLVCRLSTSEQEDRVMVFFPICLGIDEKRIPKRDDYRAKIELLVSRGLLTLEDGIYRITERGKEWTGNISAYFIRDKRWNAYMLSFLQARRDGTNPYNDDYMGVTEFRDTI